MVRGIMKSDKWLDNRLGGKICLGKTRQEYYEYRVLHQKSWTALVAALALISEGSPDGDPRIINYPKQLQAHRQLFRRGRYPRFWRRGLGVQDFWCRPPYAGPKYLITYLDNMAAVTLDLMRARWSPGTFPYLLYPGAWQLMEYGLGAAESSDGFAVSHQNAILL